MSAPFMILTCLNFAEPTIDTGTCCRFAYWKASTKAQNAAFFLSVFLLAFLANSPHSFGQEKVQEAATAKATETVRATDVDEAATTSKATEKSANTKSANTKSANTKSANTKSANTKSANTPKDVLQQKGPLQDIIEPMNKLVNVDWQAGKLNLSIQESYQEISPIVESMRETIGWGGGSSSYGGRNNAFRFSIESQKVNGLIKREKKGKGMVSMVQFTEIVKPFRAINLSTDDTGKVRLVIRDTGSAYLLRLFQSEDGQLLVQELNGTEVFAGSSDDFDTFCREHREFTANRLLPILKHFGIGNVLTPYSQEVQQQVTRLLLPWDPDELKTARSLTKSLDSESYEDREAAFKSLEENFKGNEAILSRVVHDKQFHPETRSRVKTLLREKAEPAAITEQKFIGRIVQNMDESYLLDLIDSTTDKDARKSLIVLMREGQKNAEQLSEADLIKSARVRMTAAQAQVVQRTSQQPDLKLLGEIGILQEISEHTGRLVKITWHEDQICVDRAQWKSHFGGREVEELSKEVQEFVKKNNLPANWYQPGGAEFALASAQHPQVLFEMLQEKADSDQSNNSRRHYGRNGLDTPNRIFDSNKFKAELVFDKKNRGTRHVRRSTETKKKDLNKLPFLLLLSEKAGPQRTLSVDETKPGELQIMLTGDNANYIIQLIMNESKVVVQDVRGSKIQAFEAATFRELQKKHPEYFQDSFFPLLRHMGLEIDPAVDAGPKAHETTSTSGNKNEFASSKVTSPESKSTESTKSAGPRNQ